MSSTQTASPPSDARIESRPGTGGVPELRLSGRLDSAGTERIWAEAMWSCAEPRFGCAAM